jgi:uroporphyrinogen decarboxylase
MSFSQSRSPKEVKAWLEDLYGHPEKESLSPRQRVIQAVGRQLPDRIPFDFWGVPEVISRLVEYLDVSGEQEMLRLLGTDCRVVWPEYIGTPLEKFPDNSYYDAWGFHRKLVRNNFSSYEEYAGYPLAGAKTAEDVRKWDKWHTARCWDWSKVPQQIDAMNTPVPYHIRYEVGGIFEFAWAVYGLEKFLIDLVRKPEVPVAILECYTDVFIDNVRSLMEATGDRIDMLYTYDDIATQSGLLMSPQMWRQFILPCHQRLNAAIKDYGVKIMYHSCGAIYKLIQPLVDEMHIDVLNPLQPRARGMDMALIKHEFGSRIAFHGGIDLQYTLPFGSPQEVADEVRQRCRVLGEGGGYICTSAHYLQNDVPIENIIALYTTPRQPGSE